VSYGLPSPEIVFDDFDLPARGRFKAQLAAASEKTLSPLAVPGGGDRPEQEGEAEEAGEEG